MIMKRSTIVYSLFLFIFSLSIVSATAIPLSWDGTVEALNGKSDYSHYEFRISNISIENLGNYYNATISISFNKCILVENETPKNGCPVEDKKISFIIKRNTNTFMLSGKPAFFFLYWPNFSRDKPIYTSGIELKPSPTELYIKNESPENYIGWAVSLEGGPIKALRCTGMGIPKEPNEPMYCVEEKQKNISIRMDFKGQYLVDGIIYLHSDPFGIIKNNTPVLVDIFVTKTPTNIEFLKKAKSISPPSNPKKAIYLGIIGISLLLALAVKVGKR
jgi:hypothetical protein